MNVLSLFDGISAGQVALQRAGIKVDKYYASEIDKYAILITQRNHPDTIQLGDITEWESWDIDWSSISLVIGGSPCQGFSMAGKQLAFDDPRSRLFFVFVDIVNHVKKHNPSMKFLLENVRMKKEHLAVITEYMGVEPTLINSALVSAQNRNRYYWTNTWGGFIDQPEDKGILLKDIIEDGTDVDRDKSYCIDANYFKGGSLKNYHEKKRRQLVMKQSDKRIYEITASQGRPIEIDTDILPHSLYEARTEEGKKQRREARLAGRGDTTPRNNKTKMYRPLRDGKANTITTSLGTLNTIITGGAMRGRYNKDGKTEQKLEVQETGRANSITTVQKDSLLIRVPEATKKGYAEAGVGDFVYLSYPKSKTRRGRVNKNGKANTITANLGEAGVILPDLVWRKLTPLECERLQTFPDGYTEGVSNTQRYKALGNSWTVDVIAHIFKRLK